MRSVGSVGSVRADTDMTAGPVGPPGSGSSDRSGWSVRVASIESEQSVKSPLRQCSSWDELKWLQLRTMNWSKCGQRRQGGLCSKCSHVAIAASSRPMMNVLYRLGQAGLGFSGSVGLVEPNSY